MRKATKNYLEVILTLIKQKDKVRAIDVAKELGFSKPSVSRAIKILKEEDLILLENNKFIKLTDKGYKLALDIYDKHRHIAEFLELTLNLNKEEAELDACKIEHILNEKTFFRIKEYVHKRVKHNE